MEDQIYKDDGLRADKLKADNGDRYACIRLIDQLLKKSGTVPPKSNLSDQVDFLEKMIIDYEYDDPFFKEAFNYCLLSAEKYQDPEGMWRLGWRYWLGEGTAMDKGKAIQWWKKAAWLGFSMAINHLNSLGTPLLPGDIASIQEKNQRKKSLNAIRKLVEDGKLEEGMKRFLENKKDRILGPYIDQVTEFSSSLLYAKNDFNRNQISMEAYIQIRDKKLAAFIDVLSTAEEQIDNE